MSGYSTTGNKGMYRGLIKWSQLFTVLTINSRHLCGCEMPFLGQNSTRLSAARLSSRGGKQVLTLPSPLILGILNPHHMLVTKYKRAEAPGVSMSWAQKG